MARLTALRLQLMATRMLRAEVERFDPQRDNHGRFASTGSTTTKPSGGKARTPRPEVAAKERAKVQTQLKNARAELKRAKAERAKAASDVALLEQYHQEQGTDPTPSMRRTMSALQALVDQHDAHIAEIQDHIKSLRSGLPRSKKADDETKAFKASQRKQIAAQASLLAKTIKATQKAATKSGKLVDKQALRLLQQRLNEQQQRLAALKAATTQQIQAWQQQGIDPTRMIAAMTERIAVLRADLARLQHADVLRVGNPNHDSHGRFGTGSGTGRTASHASGHPVAAIPVPPGKASYPAAVEYKPSRFERVHPTSPSTGEPVGGQGLRAYREYEQLAPFVAYHEAQIQALQDHNEPTKPYTDSLQWGPHKGLAAIKAHMASLANDVRAGQQELTGASRHRQELSHVYRTYTHHLTDTQMPLNLMSRNRMVAEQARLERYVGARAQKAAKVLSPEDRAAIEAHIQRIIAKEAAYMAANRSQVGDRLAALAAELDRASGPKLTKEVHGANGKIVSNISLGLAVKHAQEAYQDAHAHQQIVKNHEVHSLRASASGRVKGIKSELSRYQKGQMTPPTPSKAAKDETPLQRYERLIKDAARMEIWHNAVGRQIDIASASDVVIKAMYKNSIQRNKVELALKSAREDAIAAQLGSNRSQLTNHITALRASFAALERQAA